MPTARCWRANANGPVNRCRVNHM
eukprot:SAG22_NODE_1544_length_4159_cov_2.435468_4_plen_23_part_01